MLERPLFCACLFTVFTHTKLPQVSRRSTNLVSSSRSNAFERITLEPGGVDRRRLPFSGRMSRKKSFSTHFPLFPPQDLPRATRSRRRAPSLGSRGHLASRTRRNLILLNPRREPFPGATSARDAPRIARCAIRSACTGVRIDAEHRSRRSSALAARRREGHLSSLLESVSRFKTREFPQGAKSNVRGRRTGVPKWRGTTRLGRSWPSMLDFSRGYAHGSRPSTGFFFAAKGGGFLTWRPCGSGCRIGNQKLGRGSG